MCALALYFTACILVPWCGPCLLSMSPCIASFAAFESCYYLVHEHYYLLSMLEEDIYWKRSALYVVISFNCFPTTFPSLSHCSWKKTPTTTGKAWESGLGKSGKEGASSECAMMQLAAMHTCIKAPPPIYLEQIGPAKARPPFQSGI